MASQNGFNPFMQPTSASFESDDDGGDEIEDMEGEGSGASPQTPQIRVVGDSHPSPSPARVSEALPPGAVLVELSRPNIGVSFGFSLGCDQATGAKWVKKVAPGGLAEGKLKVGQQVLVANGVSLLPLSHRDSVLILRDKLVITLGVTDWSSIGSSGAADDPVVAAANPVEMSYIEMMCADEREDNALARSILHTDPQARPLSDEQPEYENWDPVGATDGSGCLFVTSTGTNEVPTPRPAESTAFVAPGALSTPASPSVKSNPFVPPELNPPGSGVAETPAYENWGGNSTRLATAAATAKVPPQSAEYENWKPDDKTPKPLTTRRNSQSGTRTERRKSTSTPKREGKAAADTVPPSRDVGEAASLGEVLRGTDARKSVSNNRPKQAGESALDGYNAIEKLREAAYACVHGTPEEREAALKVVDMEKYVGLTRQHHAVVDGASQLPATFTSGRTGCAGNLIKEGAVRKNWKERWFEFDLRTRAVKYYPNKSKAVLKGGILLQEVQCAVLSAETTEKGKRSFSVVCDTRTYNLTADSPGTVKSWIVAFNAIGKHAHNRVTKPRTGKQTPAPVGFG
eukprot:m.25545 g.25545  ORF g.25545 m.25545 type:complete len:573 (+) comp6212_c0_seq2:1393-3111(+)